MTVLTTIPNGASNKDIRDTLNAALADIALLKQGGSITPTPTVTISGALSKPEGNSGATLYVYTVTRSATTGAVNVPWSFAAGNTDAADFTGGALPAGGTVAMAAGVATGTITISVNGDTTVEGDETFTVSIAAPAGYAAGSAMSATGTIVNDDTAPVGTALPQASAIAARFSASALQLADGAAVSGWPSTVGNDAATPTADGAPTFRTGGIGGKPYVDFDGSKRFALSTGGPLSAALTGSEYTILLVYQKASATQYGYSFTYGGYGGLSVIADGTVIGGQDFNGLALPVEDQTFFFAGIVKDPLDGDCRGVCNGTLSTKGASPGASGTPYLGGADFENAKFHLSEMIVWNKALTASEIVQFSKWAHEQHSQPYPWAADGKFRVWDGDSIMSNQNGSGGSRNALPYRVARAKGWKLGTYTYVGFAGKSVMVMSNTIGQRVGGIPALIAPAVGQYFGFEYANQSSGTGLDAAVRSKTNITTVRSLGFGYIGWGTSTDIADGAGAYGDDPARRAAYNGYDFVGQGGADLKINIHLDPTVGVEGACPATPGPYGPNFSDVVHPADPGYVALANTFIAALS